MKKSVTEQRQIENEAVFRGVNEQKTASIKDVNEMAKEEGHLSLINNTDVRLHFYCECSDENCRERIILATSEYEALHKDRKQFILKPGHNAKAIEEVVSKKSQYSVVKKFIKPPEQAAKLQQTSWKYKNLKINPTRR